MNIVDRLVQYVSERGIAMPHYTDGSKITEEAAELVEAIQSGDVQAIMEEVADVVITAAVAARQFGFTVEHAIEIKTKKDAGRGYKKVPA